MPTLFTDPRSGGIKKSSGVNVLPLVQETWAEVRDDSNPIDWLLTGYHGTSKTEITVLTKGHGGLKACANALPNSEPVFGGVRLSNGKFVHFFYADEDTSVMKKGRASMHKNGVLNVLEGCVDEIKIQLGMTEDDLLANQSSSSLLASSNASSGFHLNKTFSTSFDNNNASSKVVIEEAEGKTAVTIAAQTLKETNDQSIQSIQQQYQNSCIEQKMKTVDINTVGKQNESTKNGSNQMMTMKKKSTRKYELVHDNTHEAETFDNHQQRNKTSTSTIEQKVVEAPVSMEEPEISEQQKQPSSSSSSPITSNMTFVPYSELKGISDITLLPSGVDPLNREVSLSDEEFYQVFEMNKESFYKLPTWKRVNKKKDKLLF